MLYLYVTYTRKELLPIGQRIAAHRAENYMNQLRALKQEYVWDTEFIVIISGGVTKSMMLPRNV